MPPLRFHKNPEAAKPTLPPAAQSDEAEDQFEAELTFCMEYLEYLLKDTNINQKKRDDTAKAISILKNPKQLKIRKRQVMKTYVGDYRAKMADQATAETKSTKTDIELKIKNSNSAKSDSTFIKKASPNPNPKQEFLFNFKLETTSICSDETNGDFEAKPQEKDKDSKSSEAETENIADLQESLNANGDGKENEIKE